MKSSFTLVAVVLCALSCSFSILAANEEPVPTASPSAQAGSPAIEGAEKPEVFCTSPSGALRIANREGAGRFVDRVDK